MHLHACRYQPGFHGRIHQPNGFLGINRLVTAPRISFINREGNVTRILD
jgi:hypothetical protein